MIRFIKAKVRLSDFTSQDSEGNSMLKAHAYKAQTVGFVKVTVSNYSGDWLGGYIGLTSNPPTEGEMVCCTREYNPDNNSVIGMLVLRDEYFEIIFGGTNTPNIQWKSVGHLKKPIDYN